MKKITFVNAGIALLILLNLATITFCFVGEHHFGKRKHMAYKERGDRNGKMENCSHFNRKSHFSRHEDLGLNEEQKVKMEKLREERHKTMKAFKEKNDALRKKESELLKQDKLNETETAAIAKEFGDLETQTQLDRIKHMQAVLSILTKEQKTIFLERGKGMREKHQGHREFRD